MHKPNKLVKFEDVMARDKALGAWVVWEVDWVLVFRVVVFE